MDEEQASRVVCELYDTWYPTLVRYAYRSLGALERRRRCAGSVYGPLQAVGERRFDRAPLGLDFAVVRRRIGREVRRHLETTALHDPLDVLDSLSQGQVQPLPFVLDGSGLLRVSDLSGARKSPCCVWSPSKYREIGKILGIAPTPWDPHHPRTAQAALAARR